MRIKSYFVRSVEEAVSQARAELGEEAMLMNSRKTLPEARHLGEYEVVFALAGVPSAAAGAEAAAAPAPPPDRLAREMADLRRELEGMRRTLTRASLPGAQWLGSGDVVADVYAVLTGNEVNPDLAAEVVREAAARISSAPRGRGAGAGRPAEPGALERALAEEIHARAAVEPALGRGGTGPAITALVGPPGAGKTSTLVKLAVNYGLASRRPVVLLSTDTYRVAAAEQLRSFAAILGVAFQLVETVGGLAQALAEHSAKDLILIDTAGLGFSDLDSGTDLAHFFATRADIDTQLVLAASMKATDLTRVIDAYDSFHPRRLVFTRIDETASFGPLFNELARTRKPVSFFGTGQRIPEDLEAATRERLLEMLLAGPRGRAISAA